MGSRYVSGCTDYTELFALLNNLTFFDNKSVGMGLKRLCTVAVVNNAIVAEARIPVSVILCDDNLTALCGTEGLTSCVAVRLYDVNAPVRRAVGI